MPTDTKLCNLKPQDKLFKMNDRDGLYVAVTEAGSISFRYNYSINRRQETLTFGRYGIGGITLAEAREQLGEAKKMIAAGKSPAKEKARDKARVKDAETFGACVENTADIIVSWRASCLRNGRFHVKSCHGTSTCRRVTALIVSPPERLSVRIYAFTSSGQFRRRKYAHSHFLDCPLYNNVNQGLIWRRGCWM